MMLYEEESKGLAGREDIYTMARALSRGLSRARRWAYQAKSAKKGARDWGTKQRGALAL